MKRVVGTVVRGIRCSIIKQGDDLARIVCDNVIEASKQEGFTINDRDIIGITESVVARTQGNYVTVDDIAKDISSKFSSKTVGVVFPITSRNRFSILLKGIARGCDKIVLLLSYPSDEVGNALFDEGLLDGANVNPYCDVLDLDTYRELFGYNKHQFTGVDYVSDYIDIIKGENCQVEVIFGNNPRVISDYCDSVLHCDIHSRFKTRKILKDCNIKEVYGLDQICNSSIDGSGYNEVYGLLGSNKASEESVKLFPHYSDDLLDNVCKYIKEYSGKDVEVIIYGDGAYKDPLGHIWELADPCVGVNFTKGLIGTPNEIKIKYLADNDYKGLSGQELDDAIRKSIVNKEESLVGDSSSTGTTPRRLSDLIGSLCDLTSGSGDKGTPIIYISGYFNNYND